MQAVKPFPAQDKNPEQEFKAIGLASYFDVDEDNGVDWEDVFYFSSIAKNDVKVN